jgi:putative ABC transport system ATP-binding protein
VRRVATELGKTVIIVTHNTAIAAMADRVVKVGSGVIESVKDNPAPSAVAEIAW